MDSKVLRSVLWYYGGFGVAVIAYYFLIRWPIESYYHSAVVAGYASGAFFVVGFIIVSLMLISKVTEKTKDSLKLDHTV